MGDSQAPLGARLGRLHAWRDRGSVYTEGLRTSAQAALLMAGVAKGAAFTGTGWALALGLGLFVGLEALKVTLGYWDYRLRVMHEMQRIVAEASPVTMRMVAALEKRAG
ncbi:MAG TPA: hypothetical protein VN524_07080 [Hyphomicrobiaceae bacterium]|jgi:hypothetical protein|nr:hypothetical protein [Hyphomicrobiaceae bacterium]